MSSFGLPSPRTSGPLWKKLEGVGAEEPEPKTIACPSADVVARAIVTAAKLFNENPIRIAEGRYHNSGRYIAFYALTDEYPDYPREPMARMVGAKRFDAFLKKAAVGRSVLIFVTEERITTVREAILKERFV